MAKGAPGLRLAADPGKTVDLHGDLGDLHGDLGDPVITSLGSGGTSGSPGGSSDGCHGMAWHGMLDDGVVVNVNQSMF